MSDPEENKQQDKPKSDKKKHKPKKNKVDKDSQETNQKEQKTNEPKSNENVPSSHEKEKEKKFRKRIWSAFEPLRKKASEFVHRPFIFGKPKRLSQRSEDSNTSTVNPTTSAQPVQTRPSRALSYLPTLEQQEKPQPALGKTTSFHNLPSQRTKEGSKNENVEDRSHTRDVVENLSVTRLMSILDLNSVSSEPLLEPFFGAAIESMHKFPGREVPTFVILLASVLLKTGITKPRLFSRKNYNIVNIEQWRRELSVTPPKSIAQQREFLLQQSPYTVAGLFVYFLMHLPSSLIPTDILTRLVFPFEMYSEYKKLGRSLIQSLIYSLAPPNRRLFLFVIAFLKQYIECFNKSLHQEVDSSIQKQIPNVNLHNKSENQVQNEKEQNPIGKENEDDLSRRGVVIYTSTRTTEEDNNQKSPILYTTDSNKQSTRSSPLQSGSIQQPTLPNTQQQTTQSECIRHPVIYFSTVATSTESTIMNPPPSSDSPQSLSNNLESAQKATTTATSSLSQNTNKDTETSNTNLIELNETTPLFDSNEQTFSTSTNTNASQTTITKNTDKVNGDKTNIEEIPSQKSVTSLDSGGSHIPTQTLASSKTKDDETEEEKKLTQIDIQELYATLAPAIFRIETSEDDKNDENLSELTKTISFLEQTSTNPLYLTDSPLIIDEQKKRELEEQRLKILEFLLTEPGIFEEEERDIQYSGYDSNVRFIKEATPNRLIEKLLDETYIKSDSEYRKVFFLTYRYFISSRGLLQKILNLYPRGQPETLKSWKVQLRVRILNVIQNWIESYYYELLEEKDFTEELYQFVKEVINNATIPEMESMKYFRSMFFECDPESVLPKNIYGFPVGSFEKVDPTTLCTQFLQLDPKAFALTLTLWDHQLFSVIPIYEFIYYNSPMTSLNRSQINNFARRFMVMWERTKKVREWVSKEIMHHADDITKQANVVKHFIRIAQNCRIFNNFNGCYMIVEGITHKDVNLSPALWERVGNQNVTVLNSLRDIYAPDNVWVSYRSIVSQTSLPLVPWLEIYPKLLSHLEEGEATIKSGEKLVNFAKLRTVYNLLKDIKKYQETLFTYQPDPACAKFLVQLFENRPMTQTLFTAHHLESTLLYQPQTQQLKTESQPPSQPQPPFQRNPEVPSMSSQSAVSNTPNIILENRNQSTLKENITNLPQNESQKLDNNDKMNPVNNSPSNHTKNDTNTNNNNNMNTNENAATSNTNTSTSSSKKPKRHRSLLHLFKHRK